VSKLLTQVGELGSCVAGTKADKCQSSRLELVVERGEFARLKEAGRAARGNLMKDRKNFQGEASLTEYNYKQF
jgi:hypothetical protein